MPSGSILVLEDDDNARELLVDVLQDRDYDVEGAASAEEAIRRTEEREFDLVLSDVRMAGAKDGIAALTHMKQRRPQLRTIVMTGYADEQAPTRALQIRVDDYIYKPFELSELLDSIARVRKEVSSKGFFQRVKERLFGRRGQERNFQVVQEIRARCLQHFWLAIRSKALYKETALSFWDDLEILEKQYLDAVASPDDVPLDAWRELADRYTRAQTRIEQLAAKAVFQSARPRGPESVSKERFAAFFDRVLKGEVMSEELLSAVYLRTLSPERLEAEPDLRSSYEALWGAPR